MTELPAVYAALIADGADFDRMVESLTPEQWQRATPAPGWTVAHQVAHLAATFKLAGLAAGVIALVSVPAHPAATIACALVCGIAGSMLKN